MRTGMRDERSGRACLIGIGLDLNTTNYSSPLVDGRVVPEAWNDELGLGLPPDELARWSDELTRVGRAGPDRQPDDGVARRTDRQPDRCASSRSAGRASRSRATRRREFRPWRSRRAGCGSGELDAAVVGAVDFAGDARAVMARRHHDSGRIIAGLSAACDGAVAVVVKRLEDAAARRRSYLRDPRREIATGWGDRPSSAPINERGAVEIGSIEAELGHAGAADGAGDRRQGGPVP